MTTFLRDMSHFDADTSLAGFAGCTHKITEGTGFTDPAYASRMNALRAPGRVLGSYHVLHTGDLAGQLDYWVAKQDQLTPWWRDWPHWVMQIDAEKWPNDPVSVFFGRAAMGEKAGPLHHLSLAPEIYAEHLQARMSTTVAFAGMLAGAGLPGRPVCYASRGQFGNSLAGIALDLWNAAYHGTTYPGDGAADWSPYSGRTPILWQYTSTPYDKNAFRGSVAELLAYIEGGEAVSDPTVENFVNPRLEAISNMYPTMHAGTLKGSDVAVVKHLMQMRTVLDSVNATVAGIKTAGVDLDALAELIAPKVAALIPKPPTAADVAVELSNRLGNG